MAAEALDFASQLSRLVSKEAHNAKTPEDYAEIIERLCRALGLTIALATRGESKAVDEMVAGAEGYIHSEAVVMSRLTQLMSVGVHRD